MCRNLFKVIYLSDAPFVGTWSHTVKRIGSDTETSIYSALNLEHLQAPRELGREIFERPRYSNLYAWGVRWKYHNVNLLSLWFVAVKVGNDIISSNSNRWFRLECICDYNIDLLWRVRKCLIYITNGFFWRNRWWRRYICTKLVEELVMKVDKYACAAYYMIILNFMTEDCHFLMVEYEWRSAFWSC